MGRAILVDMARVDVSGARDFGEVVELFGEHCHRPSLFRPDEIGEALRERLAAIHYDPLSDAIIVSGSSALLTMVAAWIGTHYGRFNALIFDTRDRCYRRLTLGGQNEASRTTSV